MIARKVMLLGEIGVGKSSIVQRLVFDRFELHYKPTIGVDVYRYEVPETAARPRMALIVWDTDGNFGDKIFRHVYMREASAAVIVGDVTRPRTIETVTALADGFREELPGRSLSLVVNKIDLSPPGEEAKAETALRRIAPSVYPTSAKTGHNVRTVFAEAADAIDRRRL
jgi:Ras-related protein Rab-5C